MKKLKVFKGLKELKGKMSLVLAGIATGTLVLSGCEGVVIEPQSSEVVSEITSEEVVETSEVDPIDEKYPDPFELDETYSKIPEELLDENGLYHPAEITEDELREKIETITDKYSYTDEDKKRRRIMSKHFGDQLMRANISYISDDTIKKISKSYDITPDYNDPRMTYSRYDIVADMFFDPYLQYTATKIYNLCYKRKMADEAHDIKAFNKYDQELCECLCGDTTGTTYEISKSDKVPVYLDGSNLYDKYDFKYSLATYSIIYDNRITKASVQDYEKLLDEKMHDLGYPSIDNVYVLKR